MFPPIFEVCKDDSSVRALLGSAPCRFYPFGEAPQGVAMPYAVWQLISGAPQNYLGQRPDIDLFSVQIDVYADAGTAARSVAQALRNAIEPAAHVTAYNGEGRDPDTNNYRYSFTVDWWVKREISSN